MSPSASPRVSRYTYRLHARAAVLEGIFAGVLVTQDVVARKTLGGGNFEIVVLTMAPGSSWLLSLFFANQFQGFDRQRLFLWAGIVGRLPLLAVAAIHGLWSFVGLLVLQGFVQTALIPAQNALYQSNYDPQSRGRLFGRASVWGCAATAVAALLAGLLMDVDPARSGLPAWLVGPESFRWLYPLAGVCGFGACLVYGSIRLRRSGRAALHAPIEAAAGARWSPQEIVLGPFRRAWAAIRTTLVEDHGFRRFEVALFVYGMGFMVMQPVFSLLFVDELGMSFTDSGLAKGVVFYVVNIVALAGAGKMFDRIGLERLGARATTLLAVVATSLALVQTAPQAVAAFALFGLAMAALNITWAMGPIHYAPHGQAARYMSVHVALVGLRAILGHPLGGVVAEGAQRAGWSRASRPVFILAACLFALSTVLMMRAERLSPKRRAR